MMGGRGLVGRVAGGGKLGALEWRMLVGRCANTEPRDPGLVRR